jgi:hypothetical protein
MAKAPRIRVDVRVKDAAEMRAFIGRVRCLCRCLSGGLPLIDIPREWVAAKLGMSMAEYEVFLETEEDRTG